MNDDLKKLRLIKDDPIAYIDVVKNEWEDFKNSNKVKYPEITESEIKYFEELADKIGKSRDEFERTILPIKLTQLLHKFSHFHFNPEIRNLKVLILESTTNPLLTFIKYREEFNDVDYWKMARHLYLYIEYQKVNHPIYLQLFKYERGNKFYIMDQGEIDFLNELPNELTIFRGMSNEEYKTKNYGFSWTLNEAVAEFFVDRHPNIHGGEAKVCERTILKSEVFAYLNERQEEEIIILPN